MSRVLPLALYPDKGKVYIEKNYSNALHEGSQLLAINHQPINKLTNQLLRAIPADGYNQTFKEYLLTHGVFREGFALFVGQPREFILTVREPTVERFSVQYRPCRRQLSTHWPQPVLQK